MSKPEEKRFSSIDPVFSSGFVLDPAKCSQLNLEEKRELVHEIFSKWSKDASEILKAFTRRELLEIICIEMGKERKYTGYTKPHMIDHLLKLLSQKSTKTNTNKIQIGQKRQRNIEPLVHVLTDFNHIEPNLDSKKVSNQQCQNLACKAPLNAGDPFCKRCSCCICQCYDDNKDPSLWLTCGSDPTSENDSCGMSCHLECALKHERTGMLKNIDHTKLDGSYYCVSCGKINGLMRTWRKQLIIAKEARRVDVLCLRISLSHKILTGTKQYNEVHNRVQMALNLLKSEVGPLDQVCLKMARGIVKRLSCGAEVQHLCTSAVEALDSMFCAPDQVRMEPKELFACKILIEVSSPTSVIVVLQYDHHLLKDFLGCRIWHRKSDAKDYPGQPTFIVLRPVKRFEITHLLPSMQYFCKVSLFSNNGVFGVWEAKWVTPALPGHFISASVKHKKEDNNNDGISRKELHCQVESISSSDIKSKSLNAIIVNKTKGERFNSMSSPVSQSPSTPCKLNGIFRVPHWGCRKQLEESDYEFSVRVVKLLENEGHIDEDFRVKFLTWFSLKASVQERRVVSAFVDALIDDPPCLAEQLVHTFMDVICCDQKQVSHNGFCTKLWH